MHVYANISILQARMQAWCVSLLSVLADANGLGAVIGKGGTILSGGETLHPDVMFVPTAWRATVKADAVHGPVALAIDMIYSRMPAGEREALRRSYAAAGVLEYWLIEVDRGEAELYQASADGALERVPPDARDIHYAAAMEELMFPVAWFRRQPTIMQMMEHFGMIDSL